MTTLLQPCNNLVSTLTSDVRGYTIPSPGTLHVFALIYRESHRSGEQEAGDIIHTTHRHKAVVVMVTVFHFQCNNYQEPRCFLIIFMGSCNYKYQFLLLFLKHWQCGMARK